MTTAPPRAPNTTSSPSSLLEHDIRLAREAAEGCSRVVASVECERAGCCVRVETCARCPRFARIEPHEAGYILLCRARDEAVAEGTTGEPVESERS